MVWTKEIKCPVCLSKGAVVTRNGLTCTYCTGEPINIDQLVSELVIKDLREIVETQSYKELVCCVTDDTLIVDLFTASAIVQVYDALEGENKLKYSSKSLLQMQDFAMKCCK